MFVSTSQDGPHRTLTSGRENLQCTLHGETPVARPWIGDHRSRRTGQRGVGTSVTVNDHSLARIGLPITMEGQGITTQMCQVLVDLWSLQKVVKV